MPKKLIVELEVGDDYDPNLCITADYQNSDGEPHQIYPAQIRVLPDYQAEIDRLEAALHQADKNYLDLKANFDDRIAAIKTQAEAEVFEAQQKVRHCEEALTRAEDDLAAVLKKWGCTEPDELPMIDALPTSGVLKGYGLFIRAGQRFEVFLRDRAGNELHHWFYTPSLGELLEACEA